MRRSAVIICVGLFTAAFGLPQWALAYLDPGSGSMLLQLLLGGVVGVLLVLKLCWQRFSNLFRRKNREDAKSGVSFSLTPVALVAWEIMRSPAVVKLSTRPDGLVCPLALARWSTPRSKRGLWKVTSEIAPT